MTYGRSVLLPGTVGDALPRVKDALKEKGFGVLTEIDVQAILRDKLGEEVAPYVILGACNPSLAHRALMADRDIGLLLPCNVVVRAHAEGQVEVAAIDPQVFAQVSGHGDVAAVADEATSLLDDALDAIAAA